MPPSKADPLRRGIMHLTYRDSKRHTSAVSAIKAAEAGGPGKRKSRTRILHHPASDLIGPAMEGSGDIVGVAVRHGNPRGPADNVSLDRPNLREQIGASE